MTKYQRVRTILAGLCTVLMGIVIIGSPSSGLRVVSLVISIALLARGINNLWFYFNMSRYMVGGKNSLYAGIILTDLGLLTITLNTLPPPIIILYLLGIHAFSGGVDIMMALETIRNGGKNWKVLLLTGIGNITLSAIAVFFGLIRSDYGVVAMVYGAGVFYSGIMRIASAFRRTTITYIQ